MNVENYKGMTLSYEDRMVHLNYDQELQDFLAQEGNGSEELAKHIKQQYLTLFNKELNVSEDSLAIEIIAYVYSDKIEGLVDKVSTFLPQGLKDQLANIIKNAQGDSLTIDMGEKEVDSNRETWDSLVQHKGLIMKVAGRNA